MIESTSFGLRLDVSSCSPHSDVIRELVDLERAFGPPFVCLYRTPPSCLLRVRSHAKSLQSAASIVNKGSRLTSQKPVKPQQTESRRHGRCQIVPAPFDRQEEARSEGS